MTVEEARKEMNRHAKRLNRRERKAQDDYETDKIIIRACQNHEWSQHYRVEEFRRLRKAQQEVEEREARGEDWIDVLA
jgi:hypothetical protein